MGVYAINNDGFSACPEYALSWNCYHGEVQMELENAVESTPLCLELQNGGSYNEPVVTGQWNRGVIFFNVSIDDKIYQLKGIVVNTRGNETQGTMNIISCIKK